MAKEVEDLIIGTSKACSDGESGKNECSHCISTTTVDRVYAEMWSIYDRGRLK